MRRRLLVSGAACVAFFGFALAWMVWSDAGAPSLVWHEETPGAAPSGLLPHAAPNGERLPGRWRAGNGCGTPMRPHYEDLRPARDGLVQRVRSALGLANGGDDWYYPTGVVEEIDGRHWRAFAPLYRSANRGGVVDPALVGRWRIAHPPCPSAEFELHADGRIVADRGEGSWRASDGLVGLQWERRPPGDAWLSSVLVTYEGGLYGAPPYRFERVE